MMNSKRSPVFIHLLLSLLLLQPTWLAAQVCSRDNTPPTAPTGRFSISGDNQSVTDLYTGLTWMRCAMGYEWNSTYQRCVYINDGNPAREQRLFTFKQALDDAITTANGNAYGGFTNWRLPTLKELVSIMDMQCMAPPLNKAIFPGAPAALDRGLWSATPYLIAESNQGQASAWFVDLMAGELRTKALSSVTGGGTVDNLNYILLVRP